MYRPKGLRITNDLSSVYIILKGADIDDCSRAYTRAGSKLVSLVSLVNSCSHCHRYTGLRLVLRARAKPRRDNVQT